MVSWCIQMFRGIYLKCMLSYSQQCPGTSSDDLDNLCCEAGVAQDIHRLWLSINPIPLSVALVDPDVTPNDSGLCCNCPDEHWYQPD